MKIEAYLPAAITIAASIIAAAWCLKEGSTISASAAIEKGGTSVWGVSLNLIGALLMAFGFITGLTLMLEKISPWMTLLLVILLFLGFMFVISASKSQGDEASNIAAVNNLRSWGFTSAVVIVFSLFFILIVGGEGVVIPEAAWGPLLGALTMIGAAFAAALCIMSAVKAGSEMLIQKPELSIWSLLFVALGEGLAIYGLIVAILLVSA